MKIGDQILETYNPPLVRWRVWNEIEQVKLIAKVLLDGATMPIGKFREKTTGKTFYQSLSDFFDTYREALVSFIKQHEDSMTYTVVQIENATKELAQLRIDHAELVKKLNLEDNFNGYWQ